MTCEFCAANSRVRFDDTCVGCCVRLLAKMPAQEIVAGRLQAIRQKSGDEHYEKVKSAWRAHVDARRADGAPPVDGVMREWA